MQNPLTFFTARNSPALLKYFNESAPIRRSTSSTLRPEAISSERLAMSMPMKQGHWIGGALNPKRTAFLPARGHSSPNLRVGVAPPVHVATQGAPPPSPEIPSGG